MTGFVSTPEQVLRRRDLIRQLRREGIVDARVLQALEQIPREAFLPEELRDWAYENRALAIDCEQTISQPYIVALMTEALELTGAERVLEIGTGSGYQGAVLALLATEVYTIERHTHLSQQARATLERLQFTNIHFRVGDGSLGWPEAAPFDRIIVTAAADKLPTALWEQLAENGLLVAPLGDEQAQTLQVWRKSANGPQGKTLCGCRFVPLLSGTSQ
jgi:protein-L-isoaspartate(D-aspartate) O-methyltransferase